MKQAKIFPILQNWLKFWRRKRRKKLILQLLPKEFRRHSSKPDAHGRVKQKRWQKIRAFLNYAKTHIKNRIRCWQERPVLTQVLVCLYLYSIHLCNCQVTSAQEWWRVHPLHCDWNIAPSWFAFVISNFGVAISVSTCQYLKGGQQYHHIDYPVIGPFVMYLRTSTIRAGGVLSSEDDTATVSEHDFSSWYQGHFPSHFLDKVSSI